MHEIIKAMEERRGIRKFKSDMSAKEGIGHCAAGYMEGELPEAVKRKEGGVFWAE